MERGRAPSRFPYNQTWARVVRDTAMETLASRKNPLVALCRSLARGRSDDDRTILLDGLHLIHDAEIGRATIRVAVFTDRALDRPDGEASDLAARLRARGVRVIRATESVMEALSPVASPTGAIALATAPQWSLEEIVVGTGSVVAVAVDVQDPGNLGAIVRVAEASGAGGVIAAGASADPFGWKALRGSMGSALRIPLAAERETGRVVSMARARGLRIVATAPAGGISLHDANLAGPVAILIGSEGIGLSRELAATADMVVSIPMHPPVESLNVAVAAGLLLYESMRQRGTHRS